MKVPVAVVGALLVVAVGCGAADSTRTLTASDVSDIPPGDAAGTSLSGSYLVVSSAIDGCNCRVGSCSNVHAELGVILTVVQQDGVLSVTDSGDVTDTPLVGGVDVDNKYSVGATTQIPSYLGQGVLYTFQTGTFSVAGGVPTGTHFSSDSTITGTLAGISYDCDAQLSGSTRYEGP